LRGSGEDDPGCLLSRVRHGVREGVGRSGFALFPVAGPSFLSFLRLPSPHTLLVYPLFHRSPFPFFLILFYWGGFSSMWGKGGLVDLPIVRSFVHTYIGASLLLH